MSGNVKLVYTISKKALDLVKSGEAVVSSGGVRLLDGTLVELAKPAAQALTNSGGSIVGTVSSLANNVQSAVIQKGVNQANQKLDTTLDKLDTIQKSLDGLVRSNALNWVNCALGIANCGISIAGFALTLSKLNEISGQINSLADMVHNEIMSNHIEKFMKYKMNIQSDVELMQKERTSITETTSFTEHLNETAAYLNRVIKDFTERKIDGQFGCSIIFNLSIAFAQEVSEYSARFYYEYGEYPRNYNDWLNVLESINSDSFKAYLKQFLVFDNMDISINDKYAIYSGAVAAVETQLDKMNFNKKAVLLLEQKDYIRIDDYLKNKIDKNIYEEIGERVCIPLRTESKKTPFELVAENV